MFLYSASSSCRFQLLRMGGRLSQTGHPPLQVLASLQLPSLTRHLHYGRPSCSLYYTHLSYLTSTAISRRSNIALNRSHTLELYGLISSTFSSKSSTPSASQTAVSPTLPTKPQIPLTPQSLVLPNVQAVYPDPPPAAKELTENIYTLPNALTFSRILLTPAIGYLIVQQDFTFACGLLAIAAFTDLLDGYLARLFNQKTVLGSVIDPAADKILMTTLALSLYQAGLVPLYLTTLIIGRDVALVIATAYYRFISLAPPKTLVRYFDMSLPSAEVHPPLISKINTLLQLTLMAVSLAMPTIGLTGHYLLTYLQYGIMHLPLF
ncbi:hypothetical protein BSLG_000830 [Batrachochytrium salamandrivorans]|nr:hypothetical protein BSLG_000830 [Batrachochytrium salamandrivorans]